MHTKRTGLRQLYGRNAVCLLDDGILAKDSFQGDAYEIAADGLARSRSCPPEGWLTGKYILHVSRIGRAPRKDELERSAVGLAGECRTRRTTSLGPKLEGFLPLKEAKRANPPLQQLDTPLNSRSEEGRRAPLHGDTESGHVMGNSSEVQDSGMVRKMMLSQPTKQIPTEAVTDEERGMRTELCRKTSKKQQAGEYVDCPPSGKVLLCGRRREMEDTAVIGPSFVKLAKSDVTSQTADRRASNLHFYGVYDGHGGSQASTFCADRLHHALAEEVTGRPMTQDKTGLKEWRDAMVSCFAKVDREVGGVCPYGACDDIDSSAVCCMGTIAPENVGTTAVVAVVSSSQIVVANCGDSRAVLSRGGKIVPLSQDHKPERADETRRVEAAGGCVIPFKGYRVGALLALSRAIGDRYLKRYVISEPEVVCLERTAEDECLILASDGVWDVIDNETACNVVRKCLASYRGHERRTTLRGEDFASAAAAANLVKLAYGKGSQDNITVLVVDLSCR